jgi:gamma-glutamylputrescine oxidase
VTLERCRPNIAPRTSGILRTAGKPLLAPARFDVVQNPSLWLDDAREAFLPSGFDGGAEVAVIGGGVTGCSCALTLAERGVRVRLYEAREIAGGASGRNGGFALRGATLPYNEARTQLGPERARMIMALTERALDRMEQLAGDAFRRVGSLRLAFDGAERDALRLEHDALREDGFAVEWVDEPPAPLDRLYRGAILHPPDGAIQPARWVRRLARHAAEAGADIREGEAAAPDAVEADAVVVAGDGFTSGLLPELVDVVRPTRGQMLATEPLREQLYERPHYARGGYDYWQQLPDGRLVIGGQRDASFATEDTDVEETTDVIQERLDTLVEQLVGYRPRVEHRWAGIWGTTPDLNPLVGRVSGRDGVWIAGGYSGHGNALGLACGDLVARAILGERPPELAAFDPARFAINEPNR